MPNILLCCDKSVCTPSLLSAHLTFSTYARGKSCKPVQQYRTRFADFKVRASKLKAQSAAWTRSGAAATTGPNRARTTSPLVSLDARQTATAKDHLNSSRTPMLARPEKRTA